MQLALFNRELSGYADKLLNYKLQRLDLTDEDGTVHSYPAAIYTGNPVDTINGITFQLSDAEILKTDLYESDAYARIRVHLVSGKHAWVYISALKSFF